MRPFIFEALKREKETNIIKLLNAVEEYALSKGFFRDCRKWSYSLGPEHQMPIEDREKVREIINDLITEGILGWGKDEQNPGPPWLKVTRHGNTILEHGEPQPYDPDGYLKYLKSGIPNIDDTIMMYLTESLNAYLKNLILSSTVMLGGASEKAFLLLFEAFTNSIADERKKESFERKMGAPLKYKMDLLRTELTELRKSKVLPKGISDDLEIQLDGICNLIRNCRNDVGHPTGKRIDRMLAFANLRLFIPYCKTIYNLIDFFEKHKI